MPAKTYQPKPRTKPAFSMMLQGLFMCLFISHSFATTTIFSTSDCKDYIDVTFTDQTLTFSKNPVNLDEVLVTANADLLSDAMVYTSACHVVQLGSTSNAINFGTNPKEIRFEMSYLGSFDGFDKIVLVGIYDQDNTKKANENSDLFASIRSIIGTPSHYGIIAYVENSKLYIVAPKSLGKFNLDLTQAQSCPATAKSVTGDKVIRRNCLVEGGSYEDYFINVTSYNTGTWMLLGILWFFFILLNGTENSVNMANENLKENPWTLHPAYSIWMVGSEQFTKGSRLCQMTVSMTMIYMVNGAVVYSTHDKSEFNYEGILLFGVLCGLFAAWIVTYFTGFFLQRARNVDRRFLIEYSQEYSGIELRDLKEKYKRDTYVRYYEYYIICIIIVLAVLISKIC
jgi:hypothetical protein